MNWDIVILGAGMIGASAAKYVVETLVKAQQHERVLLIGPRNNDTSTARGQHFDVARIVRRVDATSPFYAVVAQESMKRFRDIEEKSGVEFYTRTTPMRLRRLHREWTSAPRGAATVLRKTLGPTWKRSLTLLRWSGDSEICFLSSTLH